jgi:Rad3-related DNA helicase
MKLKSNKPVFVEESNEQNNKLNISKFQMSCNVGRGGIFFMNVRSRCAEMAEFHGHYSNLVVFMGYPVLSIRDEHIKEKLDYINEKQKSKDYDYLEQDALRHVNACLSNFCGNSKF